MGLGPRERSEYIAPPLVFLEEEDNSLEVNLQGKYGTQTLTMNFTASIFH